MCVNGTKRDDLIKTIMCDKISCLNKFFKTKNNVATGK